MRIALVELQVDVPRPRRSSRERSEEELVLGALRADPAGRNTLALRAIAAAAEHAARPRLTRAGFDGKGAGARWAAAGPWRVPRPGAIEAAVFG
jgi:hypothetical protein